MCRCRPSPMRAAPPMRDTPRPTPVLSTRLVMSRRSVIRGALAASAVAVTAGSLAACDSGPSAEQLTAEALVPLADAARGRGHCPGVKRDGHRLRGGAEDRRRSAHHPWTGAHREITRLHPGHRGNRSSPTRPRRTAALPRRRASTSFAPGSPSRAARPEKVALGEHGYVAGLAGSISASVASIVEVALAA